MSDAVDFEAEYHTLETECRSLSCHFESLLEHIKAMAPETRNLIIFDLETRIETFRLTMDAVTAKAQCRILELDSALNQARLENAAMTSRYRATIGSYRLLISRIDKIVEEIDRYCSQFLRA